MAYLLKSTWIVNDKSFSWGNTIVKKFTKLLSPSLVWRINETQPTARGVTSSSLLWSDKHFWCSRRIRGEDITWVSLWLLFLTIDLSRSGFVRQSRIRINNYVFCTVVPFQAFLIDCRWSIRNSISHGRIGRSTQVAVEATLFPQQLLLGSNHHWLHVCWFWVVMVSRQVLSSNDDSRSSFCLSSTTKHRSSLGMLLTQCNCVVKVSLTVVPGCLLL